MSAISISVRSLDGSSFTLEAERSDSVLSVKEVVLSIAKRDWPATSARLLYLGRNLDTSKTLGECGMAEGQAVTLHLMAPPPEGAPPAGAPPHSSLLAAAAARLPPGPPRYPSTAAAAAAISASAAAAASAAASAAAPQPQPQHHQPQPQHHQPQPQQHQPQPPQQPPPQHAAPQPPPSGDLATILTLRHQLGVCMAERDAARGEARSLSQRLLDCEAKLQRTASTFDALGAQLGAATELARDARRTLLEENTS
jgi:hypothetical protein